MQFAPAGARREPPVEGGKRFVKHGGVVLVLQRRVGAKLVQRLVGHHRVVSAGIKKLLYPDHRGRRVPLPLDHMHATPRPLTPAPGLWA